ncbi:MAG TPA: cupin domain-containing protein [Bryobacteraceae bacterium]|nr:cupin domain-containing protein [Bryobacteraceae bacterium]
MKTNLHSSQDRRSESKPFVVANTGRRAFLSAGIASLPLAILGQTNTTASAAQPGLVSAGADRFGEQHALGVSSTAFKVVTGDSRGGLFIMEHSNHKKGGVPRHMHHNEDEWFYVIEGDYIAEIGDKRVRLKAGDSILGPREIPHVWAFVGDTPGRLLIAFAPANRMEEFFRTVFKARGNGYSTWDNPEDKELMRAFGMELLGPPLSF